MVIYTFIWCQKAGYVQIPNIHYIIITRKETAFSYLPKVTNILYIKWGVCKFRIYSAMALKILSLGDFAS